MIRMLVLVLLLSVSSFAQEKITSGELLQHISVLASDEFEGRFTGSRGAVKSSEYIQKEFASYGVQPAFSDSYFQTFEFIEDVGMKGENSLRVNGKPLQLSTEYTPLGFSGNATVSAELVFVGYGISAEKLHYDDYAGVAVKGKIVVALRHYPGYPSKDPHSGFDRYADFRFKASTARDKGAAGIVFINGYSAGTEDKLPAFRFDRAGGMKDFPVAFVLRDAILPYFESAGKSLQNTQMNIDTSMSSNSYVLTGVTADIRTGVELKKSVCRNVAGIIPGTDPNMKDRFIVIGAHYDHLGYGEVGSLTNTHEIHNGADDNASGVSGMLELAEQFAKEKSNGKSILLIAFSGEELGLLGSSYFTDNLPVPASQIDAMINMDMIGRLDTASSLIAYGTGTSSVFPDMLTRINGQYHFALTQQEEGFGASDHSAFYTKSIPVLFFFTGIHNDYHKPSDDTHFINAEGQERVVNFIYQVAGELAKLSDKPDFKKVEKKDNNRMSAMRVYVGTIPDYTWTGEGYKLGGVSEGGPAQKAGLVKGDIMIKFGESKITSIYDYMNATTNYKPGDIVDIVVLRDGKEMTVKLELKGK